MKMTIEDAIYYLKDNYEYAKKKAFIRDPLNWALFTTWKMADSRRDYDREEKDEDSNRTR